MMYTYLSTTTYSFTIQILNVRTYTPVKETSKLNSDTDSSALRSCLPLLRYIGSRWLRRTNNPARKYARTQLNLAAKARRRRRRRLPGHTQKAWHTEAREGASLAASSWRRKREEIDVVETYRTSTHAAE